jgi:hypothetical protein
MTDLIIDSLQRRMAAMHSLYYQAVSTMDLEHVNHFEREGVLPIAFSLFHYTNVQDSSFFVLTGQLPVWNEEWQDRVQMAINDHGKEQPVEDMIHQRIGDFEQFKLYQRAVFDRTEAQLKQFDLDELNRVVIPHRVSNAHGLSYVLDDKHGVRDSQQDGVYNGLCDSVSDSGCDVFSYGEGHAVCDAVADPYSDCLSHVLHDAVGQQYVFWNHYH